MPYYLTGIIGQPPRPAGYAYEPGSGVILLSGIGKALIYVHDEISHPAISKLAETIEEPVSYATKKIFQSATGRLFAAPTVDQLLVEVLDGKTPGINGLMPCADGRYEIWLGGSNGPIWQSLARSGTYGVVELPIARDVMNSHKAKQFWWDILGYTPALGIAAVAMAITAGLMSAADAWPFFAALPATDAFTNTDNTFLETHNANWVLVTGGTSGDLRINTNACHPNAAAGAQAGYRWTGDTFDSNHYSVGTLAAVAGSTRFGVAVRIQSASNSIYGYWGNIGVAQEVCRRDSGTKVVLGTGTVGYAATDVVRINADGSTITALKNGATDTDVSGNPFTDTTYTGGSAGLIGDNAQQGVRIDNWEGGNLVAAAKLTYQPWYQLAPIMAQ